VFAFSRPCGALREYKRKKRIKEKQKISLIAPQFIETGVRLLEV